MRRSFVVFFLFVMGCKGTTQTFEVSSWVLSHETTPLALSAAQGELKTPLRQLGVELLDGPPLRFSVVENPLTGASIRGELPSLSFSEVRLEGPVWGAGGGLVEAEAEFLSLPVRVLGQSVALLIDEVNTSGALSKNNSIKGKLSGRVASESAAAALVQLASRIQEREMFDANHDGDLSVVFDRRTGRFTQNELSVLFDISASGKPTGLFGSWFQLDTDKNGIVDAMSIELSFEALAVR